MSDALDRARDEFLSEAEEIIEALGRDLLTLDESLRERTPDPDLVNDIFRGVHTLKGLSSLFGATHLATLSHELETLLDALRLGRADLDKRALDILYRSVEVYQTLLVALKSGSQPHQTADYDALLELLRGEKHTEAKAPELSQFDIDPSVFAVLTEYEEHRLRVNVQSGMHIFRLRVHFQLTTIDASLDQLKSVAKPYGEIITYLPTGSGADAESIELDILLASKRPLPELASVFQPLEAQVTEVPRRSHDGGGAHESEHAPREASLSYPPREAIVKPAEVRVTGSVRSVTQTVRVDIHKLDQLMNIVGELGIVRTALERLSGEISGLTDDRQVLGDLVRLGRTFDRQLEAMQQGILEVRMVPLGQLFERLARVGRQLGRDLDKQFNLVITGSETEVDKLIVEELSDPLMHMMRNAIDHGIESAAARTAVGKPELGTIALNAFQKGSHVVIEIEDDGGGIDSDQILQIALKRNLISPEEVRSTSRKDVLGLIFLPGMTTKASVSELSGRGVGMDVVKTNISKLGGVIDLQSEVGIGTKFTITLPITLAIIRALIVEVERRVFAIPLANVREAVTLDPNDTFTIDGHEAMSLRGSTLRLCRLSTLFGLKKERTTTRPGKSFVVVTAAGNARLGLVVDHLVGGQDVVIKALGSSLKNVRGFAGAAELGDQRLGLVLDTPSIIEELSSLERHNLAMGRAAPQRRALE